MDIVVRATIAFFFIFFVTRIVGRRELSTLEPFDLILLVVIGDIIQQGVTQNDFSVTGLALAVGTIELIVIPSIHPGSSTSIAFFSSRFAVIVKRAS